MTEPTELGADELRIRSLLRKQGVGPDADWWAPNPDAPIVEAVDEPDEEPEPDEQPDRPPVFTSHPGYWPHPHVPAVLVHAPERAVAALSPRTRAFLYNASAAGAGWILGLYSKFAWAIHDLGKSSISGAIVLGVGGTLLIAHVWDRRTRHWWPGIAWAARIPLATAILALALWAPAA
ncbi:hypothetical protein [Streptomyces sp. NPDC001139]